jgi:gliding motility-associated-like protein
MYLKMKRISFRVFCMALAGLLLAFPSHSQNYIHCNHNVVVELGVNCQLPILPSDVLIGTNIIDIDAEHINSEGIWANVSDQNFEVTIVNDYNPENGNILDGDGQFIYEVRCIADSCANFQACWGYINTIDNLPPTAVCDNIVTVNIPAHEEVASLSLEDISLSYANCGAGNSWLTRNNYDPIDNSCGNEWSVPSGQVDFYCCEIGVPIEVKVSIEDNGYTDSCSVIIVPQQETLPEGYCPPTQTVNLDCDEFSPYYPSDLELLDSVTAGISGIPDNCETFVEELDLFIAYDGCFIDHVTRTFIIGDNQSGVILDTCYQHIVIDYPQDYYIEFPADGQSSCDEESNPGMLAEDLFACTTFDISYRDTLVYIDDVAYTARTWHVIDNCIYDGVSPPLEVSRDADCDGEFGEHAFYIHAKANGKVYYDTDLILYNDSPPANDNECANPEGYWQSVDYDDGYYTYVQMLEVTNNLKAEITAPLSYCADVGGCLTDIPFSFNISNCLEDIEGDSLILASLRIYFNNSGLPATTDLLFTGLLPDEDGNVEVLLEDISVGNHYARVILNDEAGRTSQTGVAFNVDDCEIDVPPICKDSIIVNMDYSHLGNITQVYTNQILEANASNCAGVTHRIKLSGENDEALSNNLMFECEDIGEHIVELNAWAYYGDTVSCTTLVTVKDTFGFCDGFSFAPTLYIESVSSGDFAIGDTVEFKIMMEDFYSVVSLQFSVEWDEDAFDFADISYVNDDLFEGLVSEHHISAPNSSPYIFDRVAITWFNPNFTDTVVIDPAAVFHFRLIINDCMDSFLSFIDSGFPGIEILTGNFSAYNPDLGNLVFTPNCMSPLGNPDKNPVVASRAHNETVQPIQSNAITPNNDGLNDFFVIELLKQEPSLFTNSELLIYDRNGQLVYQASPYQNDWDGTNGFSRQALPVGTYFYILNTNSTTHQV